MKKESGYSKPIRKYIDISFNDTRINTVILIVYMLLFVVYISQNIGSHLFNLANNADEGGYIQTIDKLKNLPDCFSKSAQPFYILAYGLKQLIVNSKFTARLVNLLLSLLLTIVLYTIYNKEKFSQKVSTNDRIYFLFLLASSIFYMPQNLIGTSDFTSVFFATLGLYMLHLKLYEGSRYNLIIISLFLSLSIISRPTSIIIIGIYIFYNLIFQHTNVLKLFLTIFYTVLIILLSNINHVFQSGNIPLDVKEIPKEKGITWLQMNYIMAYRWDRKELSTETWMSDDQVIAYIKEHPELVIPQNVLEAFMVNPSLLIRQNIKMFITGLYSSFRAMYSLFVFLLIVAVIALARKEFNKEEVMITLWYLTCILTFSFLSIKMLEFRWMQIPTILTTLFTYRLLHNHSANTKKIVLNSYFLLGIMFYSARFIKDAL